MTIGRMIVQTWRGCHSLPHVGSHPGTGLLAVFVLAGILAGSPRGLLPAAFGGIVMLVGMGFISQTLGGKQSFLRPPPSFAIP